MPKMKTHKATAKRFLIKKSKKGIKVLKRAEGQDHFNSRENGKTGRNKRRDHTLALVTAKHVISALPYAK